ncbi:sigma-E processing peptidase SpoIIGA [Intestinibacter bartlettii]|uniref:Sporulation sigma-E factor-processing peptidase n=1 Tax=Intestinibacter bartlettii TaxID=261299 RepID=A0ABS6DVM0_9FIRM|nr:sigma-E processing peptidase SpoIIGA [Intestinibacter bartlettii]MBU5335857.1 sigma-E processing peptidase SpoIIGA [Intestinibacter bartlettii]MDO5009801.1 sigma-E processing peptidase SpoIIGA [Intestinibacter bartlettii]
MYLDYYILENLLINYIIINCTTYITKIYTKKSRQIFGAVIGTIYSVMYIYKELEAFFSLPAKFIFFIIIVLISFNITDKKEFFKILFNFYLVNIFISGSTYFIIYFTGISHMTISFFIICSYISCKLLKKIVNDFRLLKHVDDITKKIRIQILDKNIECIALLDSGNLLQDPISKNDVVIIKASLLEKFLPKDYNFEKMDISDIQDVTDNLEPRLSSRVRIIPYKHVGDNNAGMILGIKADYLDVDNKKISNIILGISNFDDKEYSAILNPRILY